MAPTCANFIIAPNCGTGSSPGADNWMPPWPSAKTRKRISSEASTCRRSGWWSPVRVSTTSCLSPAANPPPRSVQLVYAGKFIRAKGLPWLLQALAQVATPDWRLHMVGGGPR